MYREGWREGGKKEEERMRRVGRNFSRGNSTYNSKSKESVSLAH